MPSREPRPRMLTVRITLWRARRSLAVVGVVLVALMLARAAAPPGPRTTTVVVAAREVPAGQPLTRADLRVREVPAALVPDTAVDDPGALLERRTTVSIPRGLPVVESALEGERFGVDPPPGTVVVAITVSAAAADAMLRPGDVVDLVTPAAAQACAPSTDGSEEVAAPALLARAALVVDVGTSHADDSPAPTVLEAQDAPDLTAVVAVTPDEGRVLAAAATWGPLGTVLVG